MRDLSYSPSYPYKILLFHIVMGNKEINYYFFLHFNVYFTKSKAIVVLC